MPQNNAALYGLGKGEAQVYSPEPVVDNFTQLLAKQQAQRQQELKQLTDQQVLLKPDGLRNDVDRQDFFKQAQDWKQKAIAATNEPNPYKKSLLKSQADQAYLQAQDLVNRSKQQAVKDNQFQQFAMNNATRHQLTDDAVSKGLANANIGVNNPDLINDYSTLQRAPDVAAFEKRVKDLNDNRLNNTQENYRLGKLTAVGNTKQTPITKYKQADPHTQALDYLNEATVNPEFANVLQHKYPQIYHGAQTEQQMHEAHALASAQLVKDNPLYKDMGTTFSKNEAPDTFYAHHMFSVNHPISGANSNQLLPTQAFGAAMMNGDLNTGKQFLNYAPKDQFKPGEAPTISNVNGFHVINIPDEIKLKPNGNDIIKANAQDKEDYEKDPDKTGIPLFSRNRQVIPWDKSDKYKEIQADEDRNPYKIIKPAYQRSLDPKNPVDYNAQLSDLSKELKIPVDQINKQVGGKGSRGVNSAIQQKLNSPEIKKKVDPLGLGL